MIAHTSEPKDCLGTFRGVMIALSVEAAFSGIVYAICKWRGWL